MYKGHVIATTHWDREWYLTFEQYRYRLIKMMDILVETMELDPAFRYFTMDGQTIVIDDYLAIHPEKRERLKKLMESGRILIGPWYVQPDEYLVSGESLIRNLAIGRAAEAEYGNCMKEGYIPDTFGHISQIPQIFRESGIESAILWRGVPKFAENQPVELKWMGPDGSNVYLIHLEKSYGNIRSIGDEMYTLEEYGEMVDKNLPLAERTPSKNIPLLNGIDHTYPRTRMPEVIAALNQEGSGNGRSIHMEQSTFEIMMQEIKREIREKKIDLPEVAGELRVIGSLQSTFSSRVYLKQQNDACEKLLESYAEPLEAMNMLLGGAYHSSELNYAWKTLIQNHAHDSICGCSVDKVHSQMESRNEQVMDVADDVLADAFYGITSHIRVTEEEEGKSISIFNPLLWDVEDVVSFKANLPQEVKGIEIFAEDGRPLTFVVNGVENDIFRRYFGRKGHPHSEKVKVCDITVDKLKVPAFGYTTIRIRYINQIRDIREKALARNNVMENEILRVTVNPNGTLDITDKANHAEYTGLHYFQDDGDGGTHYNFAAPTFNQTFSTLCSSVQLGIVNNTPLAATLRIDHDLSIPSGLTGDLAERRKEETVLSIATFITLKKGSRTLEFKTVIPNTADDHRMRVVFPTGIKSGTCSVHQAFDVVERQTTVDDCDRLGSDEYGKKSRILPTQPQRDFTDITDGQKGIMICSKGLHEIEVNPEGDAALTLYRSVGAFHRNNSKACQTPEGQCKREMIFEYGLVFHQGSWEEAYRDCFHFAEPFIYQEVGEHRFDYFHPIDVVKKETLPSSASFLKAEGKGLILSAVKKADRSDDLIVRVYNMQNQAVQETLTFLWDIESASLTNLMEEELKVLESIGNSVKLEVDAKKIITLKVRLKVEKK